MTAPDLSSYGEGMGPEYEWLLSDHPWAVAERERRAADFYSDELATELDDPAAHRPTTDEFGVNPDLADSIGGLVEPMDNLPDQHLIAQQSDAVEPDDAKVMDQQRTEYEEYRRAHGEPDYRYPATYLGSNAADYAPPGLGTVHEGAS